MGLWRMLWGAARYLCEAVLLVALRLLKPVAQGCGAWGFSASVIEQRIGSVMPAASPRPFVAFFSHRSSYATSPAGAPKDARNNTGLGLGKLSANLLHALPPLRMPCCCCEDAARS